MDIQIEDNYQQVFRKIKRLGLIYNIQDDKISLEGPISLFKLTEKYGSAFAKLLLTIMESNRWSLRARISRKTFQGKRIYDFTLDHTKSSFFGTESETAEIGFDSAIEKEFYQLSFHGWTVRREPTVLKAGQYAFIPDFSLERNGTRIYVEIIGFWTPEYLKHKIQKLNLLQEQENMILLVNRNLSCTGSEFDADKLHLHLLFYDKKIPYLEIIKILRRYEEKQQAEEIAKLRGMEISFGSDASVISLDEIARRYGVGLEAIREVIKGQNKPDYSLIGDQIVSNQILNTIQVELKGVKKHDEALKIFERYGIRANSQVLAVLGYKVKCSGLDPENAEIFQGMKI